MEATPATADPAAIPIVRWLLLLLLPPPPEDELDDEVLPPGAPVDAGSVLVLAGELTVAVAGELDEDGSVINVSSLVWTHRLLSLQVYPKGQHPTPHVGSWPVRFVVWTARVGYAVAFWNAIVQVMGSIWEQSLPSGQHSTLVSPPADWQVLPFAQQKLLGSPLPHWK